MSPRPRIFHIEAEVTQVQVIHYNVFAHNQYLAEEKLSDLLSERVQNQGTALIQNDDVGIQTKYRKPLIKDIKIIDFTVQEATEVGEREI